MLYRNEIYDITNLEIIMPPELRLFLDTIFLLLRWNGYNKHNAVRDLSLKVKRNLSLIKYI